MSEVGRDFFHLAVLFALKKISVLEKSFAGVMKLLEKGPLLAVKLLG